MDARDDRRPARAVVLTRPGTLETAEVLVDAPGPEEVRVRPLHVGVCHSDLHYVDGTHTTDLPEVLGHEAAGVVEAVGERVTGVAVGDHVVTSLTMFCGRCRYCVTGRMSLCARRAELRRRPRPALVTPDGTAVGTMGGIGAFAELLLVHENGVATVPKELPLDVASLFGCAVLTGTGAVVHAARVAVGDHVAVVGCGGIGMAAIQGARLAGATRIVAVDTSPAKLELAERFGATDVVPGDGDVADRVRRLLPDGVDHALEAVGRRETVELAWSLLAPGGVCTVLGMVPDDTPIRVPASTLYFGERRLQGAFIGSSRFPVDIPRLTEAYLQGRLALAEMITHRFPLDDLADAFDALAAGRVLRAVVDV